MYKELDIIETIECRATKAKLIMLFIEEYAGWVQHLKSVGQGWGASGEEVGAFAEMKKAKAQIEKLRSALLELIPQGPQQLPLFT